MTHTRLNNPFPTKNVERSSKERFAEGCEKASRPNRFRLVAEPPGKLSHFSALVKSVVGEVLQNMLKKM